MCSFVLSDGPRDYVSRIAASVAPADLDPFSGIDLVHITHPGNAPRPGVGVGGDMAIGRGRVDDESSIGRLEVTTSQWGEFFNAAFDRPADERIPFSFPPTFGGEADATSSWPGRQTRPGRSPHPSPLTPHSSLLTHHS